MYVHGEVKPLILTVLLNGYDQFCVLVCECADDLSGPLKFWENPGYFKLDMYQCYMFPVVLQLPECLA